MMPLDRELLADRQTARLPELAPMLQACGLSIDCTTYWGLGFWGAAFVEPIGAHNYAPAAGGEPAIICPLLEDGEFLDLVATEIRTRTTRTRHGIATVLGREWLDHAQQTDTAAPLFADPISWIRNGCRGVVMVDWRAARFELGDLPGIVFENELLAKRVDRALRQPSRLSQFFVREAHRAAA